MEPIKPIGSVKKTNINEWTNIYYKIYIVYTGSFYVESIIVQHLSFFFGALGKLSAWSDLKTVDLVFNVKTIYILTYLS